MHKKIYLLVPVLITTVGISLIANSNRAETNGAPPYAVADDPPEVDIYSAAKNWKRPAGPLKVGLQVGHWKNNEVPEELKNLLGNTGATGGGKSEWEVNYEIARQTADLLMKKGVVVDILPTTIPPEYWADVFVAIHADGSTDKSASGFKAASPYRDLTTKSSQLLEFVESEYQKSTQLAKDPNVSRNMRGYYAFGWWKYEHAIHPMTTAIILETGFLTNTSDRNIIVKNPQRSAAGLANGIVSYLNTIATIPNNPSDTSTIEPPAGILK